jgi:hypothetical protein
MTDDLSKIYEKGMEEIRKELSEQTQKESMQVNIQNQQENNDDLPSIYKKEMELFWKEYSVQRGSNQENLQNQQHNNYVNCYNGNTTARFNNQNIDKDYIIYQLKQKYCKFPKIIIKKINKKLQFSTQFINMLGVCNVDDCFGLCQKHLETVFEGLVEQELSLQRNSNELLSKLDLIPKFIKQTYIEHVQILLNIPHADAVCTVGNIVNLNISNLYKISSHKHIAENNPVSYYNNAIQKIIKLPRPIDGIGEAHVKRIVNICGYSGQNIGAFVLYECGKRQFCLPATVGNRELCIGKYKPTAFFLNQDLLDKNPDALVIFCHDARTAIELDLIVKESRSINRNNVIITSHLGNDLKVLPWNFFRHHEVVLCPAPSPLSMVRMGIYYKYLNDACSTVKILPRLILRELYNSINIDSLSEFERELIEKSIVLKKYEQPSIIINKICNYAVSIDDYKSWAAHGGLFKTKTKLSKSTNLNINESHLELIPFTASNIIENNGINKKTLDSIFEIHSFTLIFAKKDVGKSIFALSLSNSLLEGKNFFNIPSGPQNKHRYIIYIDSESPKNELNSRLEQFNLLNNKRFCMIHKLSQKQPERINIFDESFRLNVNKLISTHNATHIIFDNITSLMNGKHYDPRAVNNLFETWFLEIQKKVCIIILHHAKELISSKDEPQAIGSKEFSIRAHTEINLSRPDAKTSDTAKQCLYNSGATIGAYFKVCKNVPQLTGITVWAHLDNGVSDWKYICTTDKLGEKIENIFSNNDKNRIDLENNDEYYFNNRKLYLPEATIKSKSNKNNKKGKHHYSEDDMFKIVLNELKLCGSLSTRDVMRITGFQETKSREILQDLERMHSCHKEGQGRSCRYVYDNTEEDNFSN